MASGRSTLDHTRWSSLAMLDGEDMLSTLPDHVLLTIVDRLDITDAARTSILSRRWKPIPAMLSKIVITVGSFEPDQDRSNLTCDDVVRANVTMLKATRSILERRTASLYNIDNLCFQFYLGDESISIGQIVANVIRTEKVGLAEFTILTKKIGRLCTDDDLLTYGRQLRSFVDACPNTFGGLARLKLENLRLGESEFPEIFSICKRLEFLRLYNCDMGILSLLEVQHPQLRELEIVDCDFERVDLRWLPKLMLLTFSGWRSLHDPLSFNYVPLLQSVRMKNICFSWHKMLKLSELLGMATISDLHVNFKSEKIWIKPENPRPLSRVFRSLRFVNLDNISEECDLNWTMFILQGAPYIEELCITVRNHFCEMVISPERRKLYAYSKEKDKELEWEASAASFKHNNLAVLRIFGFQAKEKFVSYVRSVMEATLNLQDIYLYIVSQCVRGASTRYQGGPDIRGRRSRGVLLGKRINNGVPSSVGIHFMSERTC